MSFAPAFSSVETSKSDFENASDPSLAAPQEPTRPFSIRLTVTERQKLKQAAGKRPVGVYIREKLFDGDTVKRRARRNVEPDSEAIARLAGLLGQSRIANNLNQLAKLANVGNLPLDDEVKVDLVEACEHVAEIRSVLLKALGQERI